MAEETKVKDSKKFDLTKLNTLAVVSLATAVTGFGAVAGVITGHISLAQLKKTGEAGRPLALAGVIVGYTVIGSWIALGIAGFFLRAKGYEFGYGEMRHFGNDDMMGGHFQGGHMDMDGDRGMMQIDPNQLPPAPTETPEVVETPGAVTN
jgi:hypothetical protein